MFRLEIRWDVARHPYTLFLQRWWVLTGKKGLEPQKSKISGYCPVGPPTKNISPFLIIIAKVRSLRTFFMLKVCYQRV